MRTKKIGKKVKDFLRKEANWFSLGCAYLIAGDYIDTRDFLGKTDNGESKKKKE